MRTIALLVLLVWSNAIAGESVSGAEVGEFTPQNGFAGDSEGIGSLKLLFGKPRPFRVESRGIEQSDGIFRLEQTVTFDGDPPRERVWHLTTIGPHRYTATLSDAAGPVTGTSAGSHLSLKYRANGLLVMHQDLELMPDGRSIDNVGTLTLLGIPVGRLHETITRKRTTITSDPGQPDTAR